MGNKDRERNANSKSKHSVSTTITDARQAEMARKKAVMVPAAEKSVICDNVNNCIH